MVTDSRHNYHLAFLLTALMFLVWAPMDYFYYPDQQWKMLAIRVSISALLLAIRTLIARIDHQHLFPVTYASILMGTTAMSCICLISGEGFGSPYFIGILLGFLITSVFLDVDWRKYTLIVISMLIIHFAVLCFARFELHEFLLTVVAMGSFSLASVVVHHHHSRVVKNLAMTLTEKDHLLRKEMVQHQEAESLRQAALAVSRALTLDEVIDHILAQLQELVPYDTCSVQLLRHGDRSVFGWMEVVGGRGFDNMPEVLGLHFEIGGNNPNTEVFHQQKPVLVGDAPREFPGFFAEPHAQSRIRSWLGVPMHVGRRLIGMIALDKRVPDFFRDQHIQLVEVFAAQAAIAVENARLFESQKRWAQQLTVVNQVVRKAASIRLADQLLQEVVQDIQKGFGYFNVIVMILNEEGTHLGNQAMAGHYVNIAVENYRHPVGEGLIGLAVKEVRTVVSNDVQRDPHYQVGFEQRVPTQSELCTPIKINGQVVGVMDIQEARKNAFDDIDVTTMETLADGIAVALENARLYQQAQRDAETKSTLLNEVNHRVKNNLASIIGLLYLARNRSAMTDEAAFKGTMDELIVRVTGLASVHQMLSASGWAPLNLSQLASEMIAAALRILPKGKRAQVDVSSDPVQVTSAQARHLALVINELATNAIKYALGERQVVRLGFMCYQEEDRQITTVFRDDGPGFPEAVIQGRKRNVGFDLIHNIVQDNLLGKIALHNDGGAVAVIRFKGELERGEPEV